MFPGLHPMAMMSATGITYPGRGGPTSYQQFAPAPYAPMYPSTIPPINPALAADVQVHIKIYINALHSKTLDLFLFNAYKYYLILGNSIFVYTKQCCWCYYWY